MRRLTALERAFEIAREGQLNSLSKIAGQLAREGYSLDEQRQLYGAALARQLRDLATEARRLQSQHSAENPLGVAALPVQ